MSESTTEATGWRGTDDYIASDDLMRIVDVSVACVCSQCDGSGTLHPCGDGNKCYSS